MTTDTGRLLERCEHAMILALSHAFALESSVAQEQARVEAANFAVIALALRARAASATGEGL